MEFLVLGPLEVRDGGRILPLGGAKQRATLAILVLAHDQVVSRDRLIDGVWGDSPPATAAHTIEAYIWRLRKALHRDAAPERLLTRTPGYVLRLGEEELDLQRFDVLIDVGRRALAADDPRAAAEALHEALALFRGAPLEDLSFAPFAQAEVERLDDLRLAALEQRIEADLALGCHARLIGELQGLVAQHAGRERLWAQLMLASYRSGRQGDALATYDRARRKLVEDLGIDPGQALQSLHSKILRQDPALDHVEASAVAIAVEPSIPPTGEDHRPGDGHETPISARSPPQPWYRRWIGMIVAASTVLVALAVVLAAAILRGSGGDGGTHALPPGMVILDAKSGTQAAFIPRSRVNQGNYTYADGHFWAWAGVPDLFVEIDPKSGRVLRRISPTSAVAAYAVKGNDLWEVGNTTLAEVDIRTSAEVARYPLPTDPHWRGETGIAVANGSLWVTREGLNEVLKINPQTGHISRQYVGVPGPATIAVSGDSAWTSRSFSGVNVLDLTTAAVAQARIPTGTEQFVAVGGGYGWVSDETKGVVYKIDQAGNLAATYHTGEGARPVSLDNGVLWVANQDVGTVTGIDALTGVTRTFRFGHPTPDLAAGDGRVLVGVSPGQTYEDRIDTLRGKVAKMLVQPYQLAGDDPAIDSTWLAYQVEYATCAKLLNYPDLAGTRGAQLRPEVAAAMPILSDDRRTYTFRVRPGYRFSPPSNQAVTAETFRHSIERALSPKLGNVLPGSRVIGDISGEAAYRAGTAQHISGLKAKGDTLTITLARPSADFLQRLATPIFCPVPNGATLSLDGGDVWTTPGHQLTIPSAGPYYIADFNSGEYLILKRNPNYRGSRPHALDAIALREGVDPGQAVRRVLNGSWDGVMNMYDPLLDPDGEIGQRWGAQSPAAVDGDQQYFAVPTPGVDVLAFNSSRPPFSNPRVRRAVALALNRSELASTRPVANNQGIVAISEAPSAQLLPPDQPGYRIRGDAHPLAADQARAKALMRGRHLTAALAVPGNCETCLRWARTLQYQLAEVGITVRIKAVADPQAAVRHPGTRLDMIETSATQDYADPAAFLETLVGHDVPTSWLPRSVHGELSTLRHSVGEAHIDAAGMLAHQLATVQVPATAFAYQVNGQFFSPRLGCRIFPPFGYGVDLAALCLPHS